MGNKDRSRNSWEEAIREMQEVADAVALEEEREREQARRSEIMMWAKEQKERYDALVGAGFSPEQALELIREYIGRTGGF